MKKTVPAADDDILPSVRRMRVIAWTTKVLEVTSFAMSKLSAIIDKNILQRACEWPTEQYAQWVRQLRENCNPVIPATLVDEVLANRFQQTGVDQRMVSRMIEAILSFHPRWLDDPLELVFREMVLNEQISNAGLGLPQAEKMYHALTNPDSASPDLREWMAKRNEVRKARKAARKKQQEHFHSFAPSQFLRPPNMIAFVQNGTGFVEMILNNLVWKQLALGAYFGQRMKRWHSDADARIDEALAGLNYSLLLKLPFTHSYLLAEVLYDLAPITKVGPSQSEASNPQVLSGNQINNEEDQEYVVSALHYSRLLTCDRGMHRIADAIHQAGHWKGRSILIPRDEVNDLGRFLS